MSKILFREFSETSSSFWPHELDLLTLHDLYFENRIADTPELIDLAHALRYQVYVTERKFENADQHAGSVETDVFDSHSFAGLVFHRVSGEAIGTVRLIRPIKGDPDSLPVATLLRQNGLEISDYLPLDRAFEISRFAISKNLRRRVGDAAGQIAAPPLPHTQRERRGNLVCLSLLQVMMRCAVGYGATHCAVVTEEALLQMLARMGLHFTPIGPLVSYHGLRQPAYAYIPEMLERCKREQRDYWDVITNAGELIEKLNRNLGPARIPLIC